MYMETTVHFRQFPRCQKYSDCGANTRKTIRSPFRKPHGRNHLACWLQREPGRQGLYLLNHICGNTWVIVTDGLEMGVCFSCRGEFPSFGQFSAVLFWSWEHVNMSADFSGCFFFFPLEINKKKWEKWGEREGEMGERDYNLIYTYKLITKAISIYSLRRARLVWTENTEGPMQTHLIF